MTEHLSHPLPWQQTLWDRLVGQLSDGKLPHALLLTGPQGLGKAHFAHAFARLLVCLSPAGSSACGNCKTCQLMKAGSHPDYHALRPEEKSRVIKIDQVRILTEFVTKTPQQGRRKVALIEPAEGLNLNAANALLKSLEEPAGDTVMLLISHQPSLLMATVRSRCQKVDFALPSRAQSLSWLTPLATGHDAQYLLDCAGGAPLRARDMMEGDSLEGREQFAVSLMDILDRGASVVTVGAKLQSAEPLMLLETLYIWLQLAIRHQVEPGQVHHRGEQAIIDRLAAVDAPVLFRLMDKLLQTKRNLLSGANPNKQLLIEEMLMDWQALMRPRRNSGQARQALMSGLN